MRNTTEKLAILSLSLMLVSTYSIAAILPSMFEYYSSYSPSQVDILISIPSFAIMIMILVNTWLARHINERLMITGGLLLLSFSGVAPMFTQNYTFVFISRILLGLGIGMINSKAVSMISERFTGTERTALLGLLSPEGCFSSTGPGPLPSMLLVLSFWFSIWPLFRIKQAGTRQPLPIFRHALPLPPHLADAAS